MTHRQRQKQQRYTLRDSTGRVYAEAECSRDEQTENFSCYPIDTGVTGRIYKCHIPESVLKAVNFDPQGVSIPSTGERVYLTDIASGGDRGTFSVIGMAVPNDAPVRSHDNPKTQFLVLQKESSTFL